MYTIYAHTFNGMTETRSFLDKSYAKNCFDLIIHAEDCKSVEFCDGLTGEVLAVMEKRNDSIKVECFDDGLFFDEKQFEDETEEDDSDDDDEELEEYLRKLVINDLRSFLKENYRGTQTFCTRNCVGDTMTTVYNKNGIIVDYSVWRDYLEIFGLSDEEYRSLSDVIDIWD